MSLTTVRAPKPSRIGEVWGAYSRISDDSENKARGEGGSGVARQGVSLEGAVAARGGKIFKHYVEDDTSAYKKKRLMQFDPDTGRERYIYRVVRPIWNEMLQDLRDGVITAVMVSDLDRMARDGRDLEDAIEVVEYYGGKVYGVGGDIDLMTDNGKMMARFGVTMANKSSSDTRRRVTSKHIEHSTSGKTVGGIRPFGWGKDGHTETPSVDRLSLHPVESVHLRRWIEMALRGASWGEIVSDGREQGVVGTRGRPMVKSSLRQLLFSPRNCGYRMFHGELVMGPEGEPLVGLWEPVCTVDEWKELTANHIIPRSQSTGVPRTAKYLLTGIARCGVCSARMRGARRRPNGKNYDSYICPPVAEGGHQCVARSIAEVDGLVTAMILQMKLAPQSDTMASVGWGRKGDLISAEKRKDDFAVERAMGKLSDTMFYRMLTIVDDEIRELKKIETAWLQSRNQRMLATTTWDPKSWGSLTVNQKRSAISALIVAVEISRTDGPHGAVFDPTKIKVIWRNE